jgi:hypothetical protein
VSWSSRVYFPERSLDNPFVARLWATQRIGYLSAEKRKHGGSQEINDEIRELGERFGIPTEFSSYLVVEPGMKLRRVDSQDARLNGAVATGAVSAPSAPQAFEAAKAAAAQRAVTSIAMADSASGYAADNNIRHVGNFTLALRSGVWTDIRFKRSMTTVRVKPYSDAYFKLLEMMPDLKEPFSVGERVIVVGRDMAIEISPDGQESLTGRDLATLRDKW